MMLVSRPSWPNCLGVAGRYWRWSCCYGLSGTSWELADVVVAADDAVAVVVDGPTMNGPCWAKRDDGICINGVRDSTITDLFTTLSGFFKVFRCCFLE